MKYTFHIVKGDQDKSAFASRMNLMFPEVEKKCVVDSFRKQETQKNHNHHFSKWLAESDKDYSKAQELYDKLKKEEEYKRIVWGGRVGKVRWEGSFPFLSTSLFLSFERKF